MRNHLIIAAVLISVCGVLMLTGQQRPAGPFTAEQAAAGQTAFQTNCATCHGATRRAEVWVDFTQAR